MEHSSRCLRENGTPRACRPGGRCQDCYPGAPTLGRATVSHLGLGCPKFHLRAPDPRLGHVVSGPRCRHHDGRPGRWFRDWLPDDMPHFHSITSHNDWAVVHMRHNVDSCIHVVSLYIDKKYILTKIHEFTKLGVNVDCMLLMLTMMIIIITNNGLQICSLHLYLKLDTSYIEKQWNWNKYAPASHSEF